MEPPPPPPPPVDGCGDSVALPVGAAVTEADAPTDKVAVGVDVVVGNAEGSADGVAAAPGGRAHKDSTSLEDHSEPDNNDSVSDEFDRHAPTIIGTLPRCADAVQLAVYTRASRAAVTPRFATKARV